LPKFLNQSQIRWLFKGMHPATVGLAIGLIMAVFGLILFKQQITETLDQQTSSYFVDSQLFYSNSTNWQWY
jgi:hypothetical protein